MQEIDVCPKKHSSYRIELKRGNLVNKLSIKLNLTVQLCINNFLTLKYVELKLFNHTKCEKKMCVLRNTRLTELN